MFQLLIILNGTAELGGKYSTVVVMVDTGYIVKYLIILQVDWENGRQDKRNIFIAIECIIKYYMSYQLSAKNKII